MICTTYSSLIGELVLGAEDGALVRLWLPGLTPEGLTYGSDPVLEQAKQALDAYFSGQPLPEGLPLHPGGTPFQQSVWATLEEIPRGEVRTYSALARSVGRPKASRAVGQACNRNPIPILIPCHRVVGSDGSLTGYAGGVSMKRQLLAMEGAKNF